MIAIEERLTVKEQCELMGHIEEKAREMGDTEEIYKDIYHMALREAGVYNMDYVNPKYLQAMHDAINFYELPNYLEK